MIDSERFFVLQRGDKMTNDLFTTCKIVKLLKIIKRRRVMKYTERNDLRNIWREGKDATVLVRMLSKIT